MIQTKFQGFNADMTDLYIERKIDVDRRLYNLPKKESRNDAKEYVRPLVSEVMLFTNRLQHIEFSVNCALKHKTPKNNLFAELGVWKGKSLKRISKMIGDDSMCFGFGSFEGLQMDWVGTSMTKGFFNVNKNLFETLI